MFPAACLGGANPVFFDKYESMDLDPAKCVTNCTTRCNEAYVPGSLLCGQCDTGFSHVGLTGKCDKCPTSSQNNGFAFGGILAGIVSLFVFIRITLSDGGSLDESDGAKSIGLSFIQLISLLVTFPIAWPPIFVAIFQAGGAVTVLGQHLVNLKCMFLDMSDADVFFRFALVWGIALPFLIAACILIWHFVDKCMPCFNVSHLQVKIRASCVALCYLLWPSLSSQTFSLFACRSVCDDNVSYLRADVNEVCWEGRHLIYAIALGFPMLIVYVIGLPLIAYVKVHAMGTEGRRWVDDEEDANGDDEDEQIIRKNNYRVYGLFFSAFREETWWWEGTVAARKIIIAMIGVFGAEMAEMQVHLTLMLVMVIIVVTAQVRPFGGLKHGLLHILEMFSLLATFLTLWAGSVFNTHPKCEDASSNIGATLIWCDMLSVVVGSVDIAVVIAVIVCFVYIKSQSGGDTSIEVEDDTNSSNLEMVNVNNNTSRKRTSSKIENPYYDHGKPREEGAPPLAWDKHWDEATGRGFYHNSTTGETKWVDDDDITSNEISLKSTAWNQNKMTNKQNKISNKHNREDTFIPEDWLRHEDAEGRIFYEKPDGSVQWEKPPIHEV